MTGNSMWLDAFKDPVAGLYTFGQCIALGDIQGDGDHRLIVGDLGNGSTNMKLKIYKGVGQVVESGLTDLPTALVAIHITDVEPFVPTIAIGSGSAIYFYKNLKPYFKFPLPVANEVDDNESELWKSFTQNLNELDELVQGLSALQLKGIELAAESNRLLGMKPEDRLRFAKQNIDKKLKKLATITCMAGLPRHSNAETAVSVIVCGTEHGRLTIVDSQAYTVLAEHKLPSAPVYIKTSGLFDVSYFIWIICRNNTIYVCKKDTAQAARALDLESPAVGMEVHDKHLHVACMDETFRTYGSTNQLEAKHKMPCAIICLAGMSIVARAAKGILLGLADSTVRVYVANKLVSVVKLDNPPAALCFGQYGREQSCLVAIDSGGALSVRVLRRTAKFEGINESDISNATGKPVSAPFSLPKRTKLFLDSAARERHSAADIHRHFQQGLSALRMTAATDLLHALKADMMPISQSEDFPIQMHCSLTGLGPTFKLSIRLSNSSANLTLMDLLITFNYNSQLYSVRMPVIPIPAIGPALTVEVFTFVEAINETVAEPVKVLVTKDQSCITGIVSMPQSEMSLFV